MIAAGLNSIKHRIRPSEDLDEMIVRLKRASFSSFVFQVSGWYQEYEGLTFATFRGAGHAVPIFKPNESLVLFSSFLSGQPLPSTR